MVFVFVLTNLLLLPILHRYAIGPIYLAGNLGNAPGHKILVTDILSIGFRMPLGM